jgi:hypothetical protein
MLDLGIRIEWTNLRTGLWTASGVGTPIFFIRCIVGVELLFTDIDVPILGTGDGCTDIVLSGDKASAAYVLIKFL